LEKRADEEKAALTIQLLEQHKSAQEESIFKQEQKLTDALASQQQKYEIILVTQQQAFEAQISKQIKEMQEKYQELVNGMEKNLDPTYRSPPHKKQHGENRPPTGHGRGPTPRSLKQDILNSTNKHSDSIQDSPSEKATHPGEEYMDIGSPTNKSVVSRGSLDAA
jgi:Fic family protein